MSSWTILLINLTSRHSYVNESNHQSLAGIRGAPLLVPRRLVRLFTLSKNDLADLQKIANIKGAISLIVNADIFQMFHNLQHNEAIPAAEKLHLGVDDDPDGGAVLLHLEEMGLDKVKLEIAILLNF